MGGYHAYGIHPDRLFGVGALAPRGLPFIGGLCGDLSPHRTTMTQTKRCPNFKFGSRLRDQRFLRAGVRPRYQRLQTLRRPCYRLLRHRSVKVVGTCCTRPWRRCSFPNSVLEQLTGDPPCLEIKKQRVANIVTVAWLATAGLRGGHTGGAQFYLLRQPHSPPLCLRWSPRFRSF